MMFSLIVSTLDRVDELERLLASLDAQTCTEFEVIVVDQNADSRLDAVLQRHPELRLRHLRSERGLSRGRNAGLRACAGEVVTFPDDDCCYPSDLLASIVRWFAEHPEYHGLLTGCRNLEGQPMAPKFPPREGECDKRSILRCAIAWNLFLRREAAEAVGFFREDIGVGAASPFQSGEDLDYPIRALERGFRLWYAPGLTVYHPQLNSRARLDRITYGYAMGLGRVWRMHRYPWTFCLGEVAFRSLGGALFNLCKADFHASRAYLVRAAGQLRGYMQPIADGMRSQGTRAVGKP